MDKCIYCGRGYQTGNEIRTKVNMKTYEVCNEECRIRMEKYVSDDKNKKKFLFAMVFFGAMGILVTALFQTSMKLAYLSQVLVGVAFLVFPYPILYFDSFKSCSIVTVIKCCRIIGILFIVWGIFLFFY